MNERLLGLNDEIIEALALSKEDMVNMLLERNAEIERANKRLDEINAEYKD